MLKKMFRVIILLSLVIATLSGVGSAKAWAGCGSYYTVQWGDTLSGIAVSCDTTMSALWAANPGLGSWVYAGQVLRMPGTSRSTTGGSYLVYIVAPGDTLKSIAVHYGINIDALASLNGIYNYNLIYTGQHLNIPSGAYVQPVYYAPVQQQYGVTYIVQPGDTLKILANRWGVTMYNILAVNGQITNANLLYVGQVLNRPGYSGAVAYNSGYYTVQVGDTLRIIAAQYGTTVYNLQLLNPQIWNLDLIYPGMQIRVN